MFRVLTFAFVASVALSFGSCMSPCRKTQKTNAKLIAGKHDFGEEDEEVEEETAILKKWQWAGPVAVSRQSAVR